MQDEQEDKDETLPLQDFCALLAISDSSAFRAEVDDSVSVADPKSFVC